MARRGLSAHEPDQRARQDALHTIARGERPLYLVERLVDSSDRMARSPS